MGKRFSLLTRKQAQTRRPLLLFTENVPQMRKILRTGVTALSELHNPYLRLLAADVIEKSRFPLPIQQRSALQLQAAAALAEYEMSAGLDSQIEVFMDAGELLQESDGWTAAFRWAGADLSYDQFWVLDDVLLDYFERQSDRLTTHMHAERDWPFAIEILSACVARRRTFRTELQVLGPDAKLTRLNMIQQRFLEMTGQAEPRRPDSKNNVFTLFKARRPKS